MSQCPTCRSAIYGDDHDCALAASEAHAERLAEALRRTLELHNDHHGRGRCSECGMQAEEARALLAAHDARQRGEGTEPATSGPVGDAGRAAAQPDPLRVARIAARIALARHRQHSASDGLLDEIADAALKEARDASTSNVPAGPEPLRAEDFE